MVIKSTEFIISAADRSQFPADGLPQVLLAGRSNVGKSSFINAILNNFKVARVSQTPGKTRLINFFLINKTFYFVDLPGYGFANVDKTTIQLFKTRIESYLESASPIKLAVLLLDIRRMPNQDDLIMKNYFASRGIRIMYVLTKADKLSNNQRARQTKQISAALELGSEEQLVLFSAKTRENREAVLAVIDGYLGV